jgi:hypothetical protein
MVGTTAHRSTNPELRPNFKWTNATHLGTDYAALLVNAGFQPQRVMDALPQADANNPGGGYSVRGRAASVARRPV